MQTAKTFDAAGTLTGTTTLMYNAANQLTGLVDKQGGSTLWSYSYRRDALGGLSSSADPLDGQSHTYGYSPLRQLTSDQRSSGTTSWTPDGASQLTQRVDPTGPATSTLSYDAASELGSLRTVSGTTTTRNLTLSYNAKGDRTQQSDSVSGAGSSYGYDRADGHSSHPRDAIGRIETPPAKAGGILPLAQRPRHGPVQPG